MSDSMSSYVTLVKNWYQSGQEYISSYTEGGRKKAAFVRIDKTATMQEAKCFNSTNIDPPKCIKILTNLIYLLNHGERFTEDEGTQLFFAITKLLQSEDASLRRAVYVYVKEMRKHPSIYIVTSSLLKDIHHRNPNFRRNSLRTIPLIVDASNLTQIERYIKALIVDPDVSVSSAALLSGLQMFQTNEELVKKWGTEIIEKLSSKDQYVQFHALMLVGDTKRKDANSYRKILFSLMKQGLVGIAAVQYLRMLREATKDLECDSPEAKDFINYLGREIRNKEDMVQIEACKLACESSLMSNKELLEVVKILETFLVSDSTVKKYSVLKIFNSLLRNQFRKNLVVNVKEI
jgi:coatomer subunit gamma